MINAVIFDWGGVLAPADAPIAAQKLSEKYGLDVTILPRIGISYKNLEEPEKIIAYQMMGKEQDGNTCPFLDTDSDKRSPHGGLTCRIYQQRPLACKAYPLIETDPITLDSKCKFCQEHKTADSGLEGEIESLIQIKTEMITNVPIIWRYATGIGREEDKGEISSGWIKEI